jgi:hypothetical protein
MAAKAPKNHCIDGTLLTAIVRAFRWKEMLDTGRFDSISELAKVEKLNNSYVAHVLRLTLLAPDVVESILDGKQMPTMQLQALVRGFPVEWTLQPVTTQLALSCTDA